MEPKHPDPDIAAAIIHEAIRRGGGEAGPHPEDRTLSEAGLAHTSQLIAFQREIELLCRAHNYAIDDLSAVPNSPETLISDVLQYLQGHATLVSRGYRCTGDPTHYFPPPNVEPGESCPRPGCEGTIEPDV